MDGKCNTRGPSWLKNVQKLIQGVLHIFNLEFEGYDHVAKQVLVLVVIVQDKREDGTSTPSRNEEAPVGTSSSSSADVGMVPSGSSYTERGQYG